MALLPEICHKLRHFYPCAHPIWDKVREEKWNIGDENLFLWARSEVIGSAICPIYSWFQVSGVSENKS